MRLFALHEAMSKQDKNKPLAVRKINTNKVIVHLKQLSTGNFNDVKKRLLEAFGQCRVSGFYINESSVLITLEEEID